ncbi:MAG: hypothetical protein JSR26_09440 [Proteobacteria bacterium]|nr:hypothetical protein [Pseudomonadota bacterium]
MSNIVTLLQTIGEDASVLRAFHDDATATLSRIEANAEVRGALANGDRARLERLAGALPIRFCVLEKQDDDEDEGDTPPERQDEVRPAAALHDA